MRDTIAQLLAFQVTELGHRRSGTEQADRLLRYLMDRASELGLACRITESPLQVVEPKRHRLVVGDRTFRSLPYYGCPPFVPYPQSFEVEAPLALADRDSVEGRITVVAWDRPDFLLSLLDLQARGCTGVVLGCWRDADDMLLAPQSPVLLSGLERISELRIPVVGVSGHTASVLRQMAPQRATLEVEVEVGRSNARHLTIYDANACTPPRIRVAAHYDSAFEAADLPGAADNASGVAAVFGALRQQALGAGLAGVEYVFYDAEEYNLFGSLDLLANVEASLTSGSFAELYSALHDAAYKWTLRAVPPILVEIDSVGHGTRLTYGTNTPNAVRERLIEHQLGGSFERVTISRDYGSIGLVAGRIGACHVVETHFLTCGDTRFAHTIHDDLRAVDLQCVVRVGEFLADWLTALCQTTRAFVAPEAL